MYKKQKSRYRKYVFVCLCFLNRLRIVLFVENKLLMLTKCTVLNNIQYVRIISNKITFNDFFTIWRYVVISRFSFVVHPSSHHIIATSRRPTSPYQQVFNHEFYDCKQAMDKIAKIIISNA
uniref:Uncharacterized protein n=1 Tax=Rhizophagus irregularis (strain DAOM 181602 / DAOM 197198 / MUCL 43194) TaxID=747089 RepID=U9UMI9_RHIID